MEAFVFVVMYGKFVEDKDEGIYLDGVYFGGIAEEKEKADRVARHCVDSVRGGMIVPKVFILEDGKKILDIFPTILNKFNTLEKEMIEAEDISQAN